MPKALPLIDTSAPVCCAPVAAGPMSDDDALSVALRLKALADPARVKLMSYLFSSSAGEENGRTAASWRPRWGSPSRRSVITSHNCARPDWSSRNAEE